MYLTVLVPKFEFEILRSCYVFCLITYWNMQEVDWDRILLDTSLGEKNVFVHTLRCE